MGGYFGCHFFVHRFFFVVQTLAPDSLLQLGLNICLLSHACQRTKTECFSPDVYRIWIMLTASGLYYSYLDRQRSLKALARSHGQAGGQADRPAGGHDSWVLDLSSFERKTDPNEFWEQVGLTSWHVLTHPLCCTALSIELAKRCCALWLLRYINHNADPRPIKRDPPPSPSLPPLLSRPATADRISIFNGGLIWLNDCTEETKLHGEVW